MADSESRLREKHTKKKRRKESASEDTERPSKTHRVAISEKESGAKEVGETNSKLEEGGGPWRNLQLILAIQNKEIDIQRKVELAHDFVKSRIKEGNDIERDCEPVKVSSLIVFLSDWIQSSLIYSEKKIKLDGEKPLSEVSGTCLDYRCWDIFKVCLQESLKLHISLNFFRNLLRVISCIARYVLSLMNDDSVCSVESFFHGEGSELYAVVLDCVKLIFSSHSGLLNENLELWVSTIDPVLKLVHKVYSMHLDGRQVGIFVIGFTMFVLDPFAKFLRVHPIRKTGFCNFVDKLLEPLLHAVGILLLQIDGSGNDPGCARDLLKLVEEVLSHGLFHPVHVDGFLNLHITGKYATSHEGKSKDSKTVIKSYHKHLFDKMERIMAAKKTLALDGVGELFCLLVDQVKRQKASVLSAGTTMIGKTVDSRLLEDELSGHMSKLASGSRVVPEINYCSSNLNAEIRKSLFDFFVQIMEPLLLEIDSYLQAKLELGPLSSDAHCTFKCINNLLAGFMHEKVYVKTEDTSEGACLNFLKKVYSVIMSFATYLLWLSKDSLDNGRHMEMFTLLAKELLVAVGYLLEIEYEVIGNDLVSVYLMMLSFLAIDLSLTLDRCSLTPKILALGCQLVNLYSDLRQVNSTIFALCKALRLITSHNSGGDTDYSRFMCFTTTLSCEAYAKSVGKLLCSVEFKLAIHNAIKSIPEGQASGCIRQLTVDISESMEWMKNSFSVVKGEELIKQGARSCNALGFDPQAELLGRGLSEMYTLVLDSLTVTTGNSNLLGVSIKDLMTVIRPCMSNLVGLQPDSVSEFLFSVTGRTFDNAVAGDKTHVQKFGMSTHWIFVFFFRVYMSCRSLHRQAISLMPPDSAKKMSAVMGDSFTAYSGKDWMETTDWTDEGYFSWIIQPSASLLDVIHSVSSIYLQDSFSDCCPLIYILHAVALQRLVDLNRQIMSFEYLLLSNNNLVQINLLDDSGLSLCRKKCRKLERRLSVLRLEAAGLADFIMGFIPLATKNQQLISTSYDSTSKSTCAQALHEKDEWDLGVCSVNKKSLPTAIWWIVSQNIDIWCTHAAKKELKAFLSLLIHSSLPYVTSSFEEFQKHDNDESGHLKKVTVHQISSGLLSDSTLYEYRFVHRHFASRFCRILEKSAISLFDGFSFGDVDFKSSPKWPEVFSAFDNSSVVSGNKHHTHDFFSVGKLISYSSSKLPTQICKEHKDCNLPSMKFTACQSLLKLLCWMPKCYLDSSSFSHYATRLLNLERLVVGSLLECQGALCLHNHYELFRLFVSCRKALKRIIMASCEEMTGSSQCSLIPLFLKGSFPVLWLFKSVSYVAGLQVAFSEDSASQHKHMIFSLMDHTSYVFLTLSKYQLSHEVEFFMAAQQPCKEEPNSGIAHEHSDLIESDPRLDSSKEIESWKSMYLAGESLKEQTQTLLISVKEALCNAKVGVSVYVVDISQLSSIASCFSGFLWGLASAANHANAINSDHKEKLSRWKCEPISEFNLYINVFLDFINFFLPMFFVEDDQWSSSLCETQNLQKLEHNREPLGVGEFPLKGIGAETDSSCGIQQDKSRAAMSFSASPELDGDFENASVHRKRSQLKNVNCVSSVLAEVDLFDFKHLNKPLLQGLLKGNHPEAAFFLRQLLIASSAMLRLNLQLRTPLSSTLVPTFIGISQVLLLELANMAEVPQPFSFVWLDGVLKYLEELGSRFPLTNPSLTRNVYAKLIELHLRAIGKCISLQGKKATLASHETESSTRTIYSNEGLSEGSLSEGSYCLDEFKARLRMSFKVFISRPSELHLLSAIQAIERALVGVQEGCITIYEINTGSADGGKVSSIVAAGIDCLDLVLEYVSGRKRMSVVKRHMQSLIAGLFNIILHLQSPLIFYRRLMDYKGDNEPDSGSVILMCVEVLTRVSGKYALFQMDSWQVGQSLHIPAALFQNFCLLRLSRAPSSSFLFLDNQQLDSVASMNSCFVDRQFSIDLYTACCRLLYTILKHRKSECEQCIALLEDSVSVLLHCLETPDTNSVVRKSLFSWEVQEGVKCACFLRRTYEEIRQQKDVFGRHCFKFLANYIWVYSGYGPLKTGIRREIDEALRPGVYALIDACSQDDLQHLHTVFGEGPCRNTLATLQHDYKLNFQYEGKV